MTVAPATMVKDFNVIEDVGARQITSFVDAFVDAFFFIQTAKEGFSDGIVPTVSAWAYTRLQIVRVAEALPVIAAVLTTLIRMHYHRLCWIALPDSGKQSIQSLLRGQGGLH